MKIPEHINYQQLNYIGQSHLLPGMNLHLQEQIFARHSYECNPKKDVWPMAATVHAVISRYKKRIRGSKSGPPRGGQSVEGRGGDFQISQIGKFEGFVNSNKTINR